MAAAVYSEMRDSTTQELARGIFAVSWMKVYKSCNSLN